VETLSEDLGKKKREAPGKEIKRKKGHLDAHEHFPSTGLKPRKRLFKKPEDTTT